MESQIIRWSYWLGLACTVIAVVIRALMVVKVLSVQPMGQEGLHMTFYKGALLLFVLCIATASYGSARGQK